MNKWDFDVPFVCGARNLGEALRRIAEGAAMIRTKGEPGTGNVVEAVRHMRTVTTDIARIKGLRDEQLFTAAKDLQAPYELVKWVAEHGCLPVVNFSAGGIATPADAALMMQLGCDGVFVGSGIFKSGDPAKRARAIVEATTNYDDPDTIARVSRDLGEAMVGIEISDIPENELMAGRGWRVRRLASRRNCSTPWRTEVPASRDVEGLRTEVRGASAIPRIRGASAPLADLLRQPGRCQWNL